MKSTILCLHENDFMNMIPFLSKDDKKNLTLSNKEIATKLLKWIPHDRPTLNKKLHKYLQTRFMQKAINECYKAFLTTKISPLIYDEDDFYYIDIVFDSRREELTFVYEEDEIWIGIYDDQSRFKYQKVQSSYIGDKVTLSYEDLLNITDYVMGYISKKKKSIFLKNGDFMIKQYALHPTPPMFKECVTKISEAYIEIEDIFECESIKDRVFFKL